MRVSYRLDASVKILFIMSFALLRGHGIVSYASEHCLLSKTPRFKSGVLIQTCPSTLKRTRSRHFQVQTCAEASDKVAGGTLLQPYLASSGAATISKEWKAMLKALYRQGYFNPSARLVTMATSMLRKCLSPKVRPESTALSESTAFS